MNPETAKLAMQFLARCQLTGQEVPAFNVVMQALSGAADANEEKIDRKGYAERYDLMTSDQVPFTTVAEWMKDDGFAAYVKERRAT